MPRFSLMPKETRFYAYFEQQAENIVKMAQQLKDMIYIWQNVKERAKVIAEMEQDGDAITHDIMTLLNRSYITPIDREDIIAITHALDDIADRIHAIADTLYLYRIESPTERSKELCEIILKAAQEVKAGVLDIRVNMRQPDLLARTEAINQVENAGDKIYHAALAEVFSEPTDMAYIVKWREVYKKMEATIDGCEVFADVLEDIAIKYA
jgi:uncharacterized protein